MKGPKVLTGTIWLHCVTVTEDSCDLKWWTLHFCGSLYNIVDLSCFNRGTSESTMNIMKFLVL